MCRMLLNSIILTTFTYSCCLAADGDKVFKAGAAASNITPPLGEMVVGGFVPFPSKTVHDELHARCLVLDDGTTKLALVVCDNVGIPREVFDTAKKQVTEATGIPAHCQLFSSSHTHSATTARGENKVVADVQLTGYQIFLARRISDGVQRALANLEPAKIGWGTAQAPEHVFNRRWYLKPNVQLRNPFGGFDRVQMNPGAGNVNLVEPAGPTDPEICFISVQSTAGEPIALLANYSLHYVGGVRSGEISADYFAMFAEKVGPLVGAKRRYPPFVGIMANGTSGDVNNISFLKPRPRMQPYEQMENVAEDVAQKVAEAHKKVKFHDWVPLDAKLTELTLKVRKPNEEQITYAKEILAKPADAEPYHRLEQHYAKRVMRLAESPAEISIPLQSVRIGELGVAAIPFEVFVEIGLEIKEKCPLGEAFTVSLANGSYGYLPTPEHHALVGYETWMGTNSVEIEASRKITARLLEMFQQLYAAPKTE